MSFLGLRVATASPEIGIVLKMSLKMQNVTWGEYISLEGFGQCMGKADSTS